MNDLTKWTLIHNSERLLNPSEKEVSCNREISDMQQSLLKLSKRRRQIQIERMELHRKEESDINRECEAINKKMCGMWNKARLSKFRSGQTVIARQRGEAARGGPDCPFHSGFMTNGDGVKGTVVKTVCGPRNQGVWVQFPEESGMACRPIDCFFYRLESIECAQALEPVEGGWAGYRLAALGHIQSLVREIVPTPGSARHYAQSLMKRS